jgi:hypothetical protein
MTGRPRRIGVPLLMLLLTACLAPSAVPSAEPTAEPSGSRVAPGDANLAAIGCEPIDLRAPSGDRLDMTGTWGRDPLLGPIAWNVRQLGDCLFLVELGSFGTAHSERVFHWLCEATLAADFTADGRCVQVGRNYEQVGQGTGFTGPIRVEIEFDEAGQPVWWLVVPDCANPPCSASAREEDPYERTLPGDEPVPSGSP